MYIYYFFMISVEKKDIEGEREDMHANTYTRKKRESYWTSNNN